MQTITYTVDVCKSGLEHDKPIVSFDKLPGNIKSTGIVKDNSRNARLLKNCTKDLTISLGENHIDIDFDLQSIDNEKILPIAGCTTLIAQNYINVDSEEFSALNNGSPLLGAESRGFGQQTRVAVLQNKNRKTSVIKDFAYMPQNSGPISKEQFYEIAVGGKYYSVIGREDPISIAELIGSNRIFTQSDYTYASFDYTYILTKYGISEHDFLELCQYTSIDELSVREFDRLINDVLLPTTFFPIGSNITCIIKFENGLLQVNPESHLNIDRERGLITISRQNTDAALGDIVGFYLFYPIYPMVFSGENIIRINPKSIISDTESISSFGVDRSSLSQNISVSEPLIEVIKYPSYTSVQTEISIPMKYKKCFIEPSLPISINNNNIESNRLFFDNSGKNIFDIGAPYFARNMLMPAEMNGRTFSLDESFNGRALAIFGLFRGELTRITPMSIMSNGTVPDEFKAYSVTGFGEGPYSYGGYGNGYTEGAGTKMIYSSLVTPTSDIVSMSDMAIDVMPNDHGFQYVLPAWTKFENIKVFDISNGEKQIPFFIFKNPDILILDKNKVNMNHTYRIVFSPVVHPLIESVDLTAKQASVIMSEDVFSVYGSQLIGLFILGSYKSRCSIGYIDHNLSAQYFSHNIDVYVHTSPEFLQKTITGFKTTIFRD